MNANGMQIRSICNNLKYHLDSCCFLLKWVITPRFIKTFEELRTLLECDVQHSAPSIIGANFIIGSLLFIGP